MESLFRGKIAVLAEAALRRIDVIRLFFVDWDFVDCLHDDLCSALLAVLPSADMNHNKIPSCLPTPFQGHLQGDYSHYSLCMFFDQLFDRLFETAVVWVAVF